MAEPERSKNDITSAKDFSAALAAAAVPTQELARERILKRAGDEARKYGYPLITFNHLLLAISEENPQELQTMLSPKIEVSTLQRMLRLELLRKSPGQSPAADVGIALSPRSTATLQTARGVTWAKYRSDRLFGLELLHGMLAVQKAGMSKSGAAGVDKKAWWPDAEHSDPLEYIAKVLSQDGRRDELAEYRRRIDGVADSLGETLSKLPPASAVTWDPEL